MVRMRMHLAGPEVHLVTPDKRKVLATAQRVQIGTRCELVVHGLDAGWLWTEGTLTREADRSMTVGPAEAPAEGPVLRVKFNRDEWVICDEEREPIERAAAVHIETPSEIVLHGDTAGDIWTSGELRREADGSITVLPPD